MRAAIIATLIAIGSIARADGFDHRLHDRDVVVTGADAIACTHCHAQKAGLLVGKPGHAACFGACHTDDAKVRRTCSACHADAKKAAVRYPPYDLDRDFSLHAGHKSHAAVECASCHRATKSAPHARCAGCHGAAKTTQCQACHEPASGVPLPPQLAAAEITVKSAFSHAAHAARGPGGATCTTCHASLLATDDNVLPRPAAQACATAGCHDAKAAFAITTACTKCHRDAAPKGFKVARPDEPFSHAKHDARGVGACASCHALAPSGEVTPGNHAACAGCHADDFGKREPAICGACHTSTEPWRALVPDRGLPDRTEFGADLDHGQHPAACATCHSLTTPAAQLRPPRGHRACSAAGCHATAAGPAPRFTDCGGCHREGLAADRLAQRAAQPWSVRVAFDHARHGGACETCHAALGPSLLQIATPPKPACAPCHDGAKSFKLTGTTCTRCHAKR